MFLMRTLRLATGFSTVKDSLSEVTRRTIVAREEGWVRGESAAVVMVVVERGM